MHKKAYFFFSADSALIYVKEKVVSLTMKKSPKKK